MAPSKLMWNFMTYQEQFALEFADRAHRSVNQLRKYNKMPYIEHPVRVAETVLYYRGTTEMVQAALLHDVVEDTGITSETIHKLFGPKVGELVDWLTDVSRPHHGNRATRKKMDRDHSIASPAEAQTIKVADLIDNCHDIVDNDPHFGRVYLREMELLLNSLDKANPALLKEGKEALYQSIEKLRNMPSNSVGQNSEQHTQGV
jgi:(p)ppGpp synthase/HD superfamily hydrolase